MSEVIEPATTTQDWAGPQTHEEANCYHQGFIGGLTVYARERGESTLKSQNPLLARLMDEQGFSTIETFERLSQIVKSDPVHVVCVTDEETGYEAVYVGGDLMEHDLTMYGCDIARLTSGMIIQLSHVSLRLPDQQEYPRRFEDCLKFVTDALSDE